MFGNTTSNTSILGNPPAASSTFGTTTGFSGFGNPSTLGTAGTLFSSTSLTNPTAPKSAFNFGQPTATTAAPSLFGSTTSASGFGQAVAPTNFQFGASTAAAPSSFQFGAPGVPATSVSTGFQFGTSAVTAPVATTTTISATGFPTLSGFGNISQPTQLGGFSSGLMGSTSTAQSLAPFNPLGLSSTLGQPSLTSASLSTSNLGLGGVGTLSSTIIKNDSKTLKEYPVPLEISNLVESFKNHIKVQKGIREEISHVSSKSLSKVVEETENLKQNLLLLSNGLQRNVAIIKVLKFDTAKELKNAEITQRTKEISFPLQYENVAPMAYFTQTVLEFEEKLNKYTQQICELENHLMYLNESSSLSPQHLLQTIRKLEQAFISIAAKLQTIQEQIGIQNESIFKVNRSKNSNKLFDDEGKNKRILLAPLNIPTTIGPSPFASSQANLASNFASAYERAQQITGASSSINLTSNYPSTLLGTSGFASTASLDNRNLTFGSLSGGSNLNPIGSATGFNSVPSTPLPLGVSNQPGFQLQKPPIGNKRGKR